MDSSVSLNDQTWFLRVCHHVSNVLYAWTWTHSNINVSFCVVRSYCYSYRHLACRNRQAVPKTRAFDTQRHCGIYGIPDVCRTSQRVKCEEHYNIEEGRHCIHWPKILYDYLNCLPPSTTIIGATFVSISQCSRVNMKLL